MIKEFNKNGAVALYKREFADCLEKSDYERAIDYLLKYSEVRDNPDFHAAMGILYFLMTQDSDDRELLALSYREFLMHLSTHHDSSVAYRSLLAIAILRREPSAIAHISDFIKQCGVDVQELVDELSEYGLDIFNDDSEYIDFDSMFTPADYGEIASDVVIGESEDGDGIESRLDIAKETIQKPKMIQFKGRKGKDNNAETIPSEQKIIRMKSDIPQDEKIELGDVFDMMMQIIQGDADDEAAPTADISASVELSDDQTDDLYAKLALKRAQSLCISGKYDDALLELDTIKRDTGRLYYCAECIRSNIMMDMGKYDEAQLALDRAFAVLPSGALAGTIQCSLYVELKQFDKIPDVLKGIDVADYVDSDHVFRALRYAIEYCSQDDAMALLEDYIDEFNSLDLRSIHAQMLYNAGDKDAAIKELRILSRVLYDDFSAQYHYLMSKSGIEKMPLDGDTPQNVLGIVVENIIGLAHSDVFSTDSDIINSEPFKCGLEVFLTLEFQNTRSVTKLMFETLNIFASDERLETAMRNALVSPYVEPLVKAVILGKILHRYGGKTQFIIEQSFRPMSHASLPSIGENCDAGVYLAYALTALFCPRELKFLIHHYGKMRRLLNAAECSSRDIANYLWRTIKVCAGYKDAEIDGRIHFALGYDTKTQANTAFKEVTELIIKNLKNT